MGEGAMLTIEPTGAVLGATVRGIDLARPLREPDLGRILLALGKQACCAFPTSISTSAR
jgi:taurine dioxygenase